MAGLFGRKALDDRQPMGMRRLSEGALAEQSVADAAARSGPVASDTEEMAQFRPLLAGTRLERAPLR